MAFVWLLGEKMLYKHPPYLIALDFYVKALEVKAIEFHRIDPS